MRLVLCVLAIQFCGLAGAYFKAKEPPAIVFWLLVLGLFLAVLQDIRELTKGD